MQKGTHLGVELAFKHMSTSSGAKGGVVVNLSSTAGITCIGDMYATPAYVASKHAVTALTRTFGVRFCKESVTNSFSLQLSLSNRFLFFCQVNFVNEGRIN